MTLPLTPADAPTAPTQRDNPEPALVRAARPEDALCLSVLAMQVFLHTYATDGIRPQIAREVLISYSEASFSAAIAAANSHIEVAEIKGHLVGFAQMTFDASQQPGAPGRLQRSLPDAGAVRAGPVGRLDDTSPRPARNRFPQRKRTCANSWE